MVNTVHKIVISETPAKENTHKAAPPLITTSKINILGIMDAIKYMEKIKGMDCKREISAPKN